MIHPRMRLEDAPDVLTVEQMSEVLGIGRTTAYQVIRRGKVRTVRTGRLIKIPKTAIAEFWKKEQACEVPFIQSRLQLGLRFW